MFTNHCSMVTIYLALERASLLHSM